MPNYHTPSYSIPSEIRSLSRRAGRALVVLIASLTFLSCNAPFKPEVRYTPKLNVYSILFAGSHGVYARVLSLRDSLSPSVSQPVHDASVLLTGPGMPVELADTSYVTAGDTMSYYYAPTTIIPGASYTLSVTRDGYPTATATVSVPNGYATIPDQNSYSTLINPKTASSDIPLKIDLSSLSSAWMLQIYVECRGLDASGKFHVGYFNVIPVDTLRPFTEVGATSFFTTIDIDAYRSAYKSGVQFADSLKLWHLYTNIVVTQIDDNLYRYFITSTHGASPLLMRTDKIIFSNIFDNAGTGIVTGASVDTTRIFLF